MGGQDESEGPTFPLETTTHAGEVVNIGHVTRVPEHTCKCFALTAQFWGERASEAAYFNNLISGLSDQKRKSDFGAALETWF